MNIPKRYKCEECDFETYDPHPPELYALSTGYWIVCKKCRIRIHNSLRGKEFQTDEGYKDGKDGIKI